MNFGSCVDIELQKDFNATRYTGTWFEQARDKTMLFEQYDCQQARYSLQGSGLLVHNTQYNPTTGKVEEAYANGTCTGAHCTVIFNSYAPAGDYRVVETDYENYSLVYSCTNFLKISKFQYFWLLTRNATLTDEIKNRAQDLIKQKVPDYDFADIRVTKQLGDCVYLQ